MKTRSIILVFCIVLLNSCIVKSLNPFYIEEAVEFQEAFLGKWEDNKDGKWEVLSFKAEMERETGKDRLSEEDKEIYEKYKDGYLISYLKKENESYFIAVPFKVDDQVLIDFIPYQYEDEGGNDLVGQHLVKTHSVAKFDKQDNGDIKITWLDEDRLEELFKKDAIQIKHEVVGLDKDFILTASSEELYRFMKKYCSSSIKNKWESSEKLTFKRISVEP
ncbi:hypothetical protein GWK08_12175 [Leptobacterium flavescens]|uniref:Uncharacterized protein n=1 Tax=Leptobacterium flavescens TaxID=472055 RepID=A0A6P0UNY5_9FLAO|nr:hypothetical protein [Leptobacterium flavescens]NER14202.1 hypothetical protein [Leptobacterium flavescens]